MLPRIRRSGLVAWVVTLLSLVNLVAAASITVDDANPAITYSAVTDWNIGNTCTGCLAQPTDLSSINARTWHDSTRGPNATEVWFEHKFTGTSVTVYGILVNIVRTTYLFTTNVDLAINLDGQTSSYTHAPLNTESYQYQVPVFSQQGLANSQHTLRVTLNPSSAFLFDYLVYTTADTSTSSTSASTSASSSLSRSTTLSTPIASSTTSVSSTSAIFSAIGSVSLSIDSSGTTHTISPEIATSGPSTSYNAISIGTIIGIVGGIVGLLLIVIIVLVFLLCRKRRRSQNAGPQPMPAPANSGDHVGDPLMQSVSPSAFPHTFTNNTSTSSVALHHNPNYNGSTSFSSSNNISALVSPPGGGNEPAIATATATMNSKQRRMQQEQALLPAQQPQQHQHHGIPTRGTGGGGTAHSEGSGAGSAYGGMEDVYSHTGPVSSSSGNTDYYDTSSSTPLARRAAPGVGGRSAPWNAGLYPHSVPSPAPLAAPMPVPLGVPLEGDYGARASEARSRSGASGLTRPPTAPPPYIRSPPPLSHAGRDEESGTRGSGSVSEYDDEKR